MSVFDDNLNTERIDKESDKLILQNYKVSNSGSSLIPKVGTFGMDKELRPSYITTHRSRQNRTSKIPQGIFREESSIFNMFNSYVCKLSEDEQRAAYNIYVNAIRDMGLRCLVYNQKRYYQINRETKRKVAYILFKNINNTNNDK